MWIIINGVLHYKVNSYNVKHMSLVIVFVYWQILVLRMHTYYRCHCILSVIRSWRKKELRFSVSRGIRRRFKVWAIKQKLWATKKNNITGAFVLLEKINFQAGEFVLLEKMPCLKRTWKDKEIRWGGPKEIASFWDLLIESFVICIYYTN